MPWLRTSSRCNCAKTVCSEVITFLRNKLYSYRKVFGVPRHRTPTPDPVAKRGRTKLQNTTGVALGGERTVWPLPEIHFYLFFFSEKKIKLVGHVTPPHQRRILLSHSFGASPFSICSSPKCPRVFSFSSQGALGQDVRLFKI